MIPRTALAAAMACALSFPRSAGAWTRDRLLVVVENRSSNDRAARDITPVVQELLKQKGYDVVLAEAPIGIDRSGAAAPSAIQDAAQKASVDAVVTVSIGFLLDAQQRPRGPGAKQAIGMLARMYKPDAHVVWRNSLAMILDEPLVRVSKATAYTSRREAAATPPKAPTTVVCEQLLWTLPRGRPSPEELAARMAPPATAQPPAPPSKSTRFEKEPERARDFGETARFPLRLDRKR